MRILTAVLAALVAALQVVLVVQAELTLDAATFAAQGAPLPPWWSRVGLGVAWAVPWAVGATLLVFGRPYPGTAIVITAAALTLGRASGLVSAIVDVVDGAPGAPGWRSYAPAAGVWLAGVAAGVLAWFTRPHGAWRWSAPGATGWFTTFAVLAWLPTAFTITAFAGPGVPRRFVERAVPVVEPVTLPLALFPVLVAVVLLIAPRLRRDAAGAATLTFAGPQTLVLAQYLAGTIGEPTSIPTPSGVLGAVGVLGLLVIGTWWWATHDRVAGPPPVPGEG